MPLKKVSEAAYDLGVSVEQARRIIRSGRWPVYKLGPKSTRIDVEEIKALGRLIAEGPEGQNLSGRKKR